MPIAHLPGNALRVRVRGAGAITNPRPWMRRLELP